MHAPCIVRLKLFTLNNCLILKAIGRLAAVDRKAAQSHVRAYLS
ncbi:MAG TPA: hypothetical protein VEU62_13275 [Bryobacterales bacterium]|nr:hypothetical protein [Bryobacterales bacterium]